MGDIYVGRVQKVLKNIRCAFIELGDDLVGYYPLDQKCAPVYTKKGKSSDIQQGDELLVQVKKDAVKTKALSLTAELTIAGKYLVAVIGSSQIHISSKLDPDSKQKWAEVLRPFQREKIGWIVRTNAEDAECADVTDEAETLLNDCMQLQQKSTFQKAKSVLHHAPSDYLEAIRDYPEGTLDEILTDEEEVYRELVAYAERFDPALRDRITLYTDALQPLSKRYPVEAALDEIRLSRIWLKSGGYLVIEPTEALTAIDVNTGKYSGRKQTEETFLKINLEAAKEAARQIRLRNLSGILILDFINMKEEKSRDILLEALRLELKKDPVPAVLIDMTPLGLVEVTRKRIKRPIYEQIPQKSVDEQEKLC